MLKTDSAAKNNDYSTLLRRVYPYADGPFDALPPVERAAIETPFRVENMQAVEKIDQAVSLWPLPRRERVGSVGHALQTRLQTDFGEIPDGCSPLQKAGRVLYTKQDRPQKCFGSMFEYARNADGVLKLSLIEDDGSSEPTTTPLQHKKSQNHHKNTENKLGFVIFAEGVTEDTLLTPSEVLFIAKHVGHVEAYGTVGGMHYRLLETESRINSALGFALKTTLSAENLPPSRTKGVKSSQSTNVGVSIPLIIGVIAAGLFAGAHTRASNSVQPTLEPDNFTRFATQPQDNDTVAGNSQRSLQVNFVDPLDL